MDSHRNISEERVLSVWLERMRSLFVYLHETNYTGLEKVNHFLNRLHTITGADATLLLQEEDRVTAHIKIAFPQVPPQKYIRISGYYNYLQNPNQYEYLEGINSELRKVLGVDSANVLLIPLQTVHFRGMVIIGFTDKLPLDTNLALFVLCCQTQLREMLELTTIHQMYEERIRQFYALTQHISQGFIFINDQAPSVYINESAAKWLKLTAGEYSAAQVAQNIAVLRMAAANQEEITQQIQYTFSNPNKPVRDWLWKYFEPELLILKVSYILISTTELQGKLWLMDEVTHEIALSEEVAAMNEELVTSNEELISVNENLKGMNDELEDRNHFIELIMTTTPNPIYIYDIPLKKIVYANKDVLLTIGYAPDDVFVTDFRLRTTLIHPDDSEKIMQFMKGFETANDKEIREILYRLRHADGSYHWFLNKCAIFRRNADQLPDQLINVVQDITQLKETESALRETLEQLHQSNEEMRVTNEELLSLTDQLKLANRQIRKLASEKVKLAQQQYLDLAENMQDLFAVFDEELRYVYINSANEKAIGLPRKEVIGKKTTEVFNKEIGEAIYQNLKYVLETGKSIRVREQFYNHNKRVYLDSALYPMNTGGVFAIVQDVTTQVLSDFRFKDLAESITDPVIMLDEQFQYLYWNNATEQNIGKLLPDVVGKHPREVLGEDYYEKYQDRFDTYQRVMLSKTPEVIYNTIYRNNQLAHVEISVYPTLQGGVVAITRDITARVMAEKNYRELADSITDIFFALNTDLQYVFFNKASEQFMGMRAEDVLGKTIYEIIPKVKDTPAEQMIQKVLAEKKSDTLVNMYTNGTTVIYYRMYFYPTATGLSVFARDITENIQLTRHLEEEKQQLELALQSGELGLWDWNVQTGEVYFNEQWVSFLEYLPGELLPTLDTWLDHIHDDDLEYVTTVMNDHLSNKIQYYQTEFRLLTKSGTWKWVYDSGKVIARDGEGGPLRATGITMDITRKKQYELKMEQLNEELEQKVKDRTTQLEAVNKELEAFSYSVSHDLRVPLRSIDGFSKALLEDYSAVLNDEGKDYLNTIRRATLKMHQLIEDIMKLARVTRATMDKEPVNISQIALNIVTDLQSTELARQVIVHIEPNLIALGDEKLVSIVLQNLLQNAWKYTSKKQEAIIDLGQRITDQGAIFFVKDNGVGFDMKYADKLFNPFQRLHSKRDFDGNGVGLATVQRIIAKHGGKIWAESSPDYGAVFFFTFNES